MKSKTIRNLILLALATGAVSAYGQGTITLPKTLCDSGTAIQSTFVSTPSGTPSQFLEGPVYLPSGSVLFSEQSNGIIWKVSSSGVLSKLISVTSGSTKYVNGMDIDPSGQLVVCEKQQITVRDTSTGSVLKVITTGSSSSSSDTNWGQGSNDLTFASNGDMFFTFWNSNFNFHSKDSSVNKKWQYTPATGINWNGIEYIEERGIIYLLEYGKNRAVTCSVNPTTHLVDTSTMKQFGTDTLTSCDGITVDSLKNVYICCNASSGANSRSIVVLDSTGKKVGTIKLTSTTPVNCVFGGPNNDILFIAAGNGVLYKVQMKVPGRVRPKAAPPIAVKKSSGQLKVSERQNALQLLIGNNRQAGGSTLSDMANPAIVYNLNGKRMFSTAARRGAAQSNKIPGMSPAVYVRQVQGN